MSFTLHPFLTRRSFKEQVEISIPRSLSYINNLYHNVQQAEGFGQQRTHTGLAKYQQAPKRIPRTQSTVIPSCDPELRPIITRRRTKSLPSSPERKSDTTCRSRCQRVRFADSLGLELAEVKVFNIGDYPSIPLHVLSRLSINSDLCCNQNLEFTIQYVEPDFQQPADLSDFFDRLQQYCVCLEQVTSSEELGISGTIRVLNLAFEKSVLVRYSFTNWRNHYEIRAVWQNSDNSTSPDSDTFVFCLTLPPFLRQLCSVVQFAVRYEAAGKVYWDNNLGKNYGFKYSSHTLKMPKDCEQSWIHFV